MNIVGIRNITVHNYQALKLDILEAIDEALRKCLCCTYYNDTDENRDTNPNHDGTAKLKINKDESNRSV